MRVKNKTKEELVRNDICRSALYFQVLKQNKFFLQKPSMVWLSAVLFELMILMTMLMVVVTMIDSDDENKKARCSGI